MTSILLTGVPGAGKSTVCEALDERGHRAIDLEAVPGLCTFVDPVTGDHIAEDMEDPVVLDRGEWRWDERRLRRLLADHDDQTTVFAGTASNALDLRSCFDEVVLLEVSAAVMRRRLTARNGFGRTESVQEHILSWKEWWEDQIRATGAISVDANGSVADTLVRVESVVIDAH